MLLFFKASFLFGFIFRDFFCITGLLFFSRAAGIFLNACSLYDVLFFNAAVFEFL